MKCCACLLVLAVLGCGHKEEDKVIDGAAWKQTYGAEASGYARKLDAAVALAKELPAESVHHADPAVPFKWKRDASDGWETSRILMGYELRELPEYERAQALKRGGDDPITVDYFGQTDLDLDTGRPLASGDKPAPISHASAADILMKKLHDLRFVLIAREVSYEPATIDAASKTFRPGTYRGVVHVIDLEGPKHLGSVTFSATNTARIESFKGNEKGMLQADLVGEAMKAFRAAWPKVFPNNPLPPG